MRPQYQAIASAVNIITEVFFKYLPIASQDIKILSWSIQKPLDWKNGPVPVPDLWVAH